MSLFPRTPPRDCWNFIKYVLTTTQFQCLEQCFMSHWTRSFVMVAQGPLFQLRRAAWPRERSCAAKRAGHSDPVSRAYIHVNPSQLLRGAFVPCAVGGKLWNLLQVMDSMARQSTRPEGSALIAGQGPSAGCYQVRARGLIHDVGAMGKRVPPLRPARCETHATQCRVVERIIRTPGQEQASSLHGENVMSSLNAVIITIAQPAGSSPA